MAILWHELWHEALEEASRQYFGESNVEAMLATLLPLHQMMEANGPVTLKEIAFVQVRSTSVCLAEKHVVIRHPLGAWQLVRWGWDSRSHADRPHRVSAAICAAFACQCYCQAAAAP